MYDNEWVLDDDLFFLDDDDEEETEDNCLIPFYLEDISNGVPIL